VKTSGEYTFEFGKRFRGWRLQFYWPELTIRRWERGEIEWLVGFDTRARIVSNPTNGYYYGAGFRVLGFGVGADFYHDKHLEAVDLGGNNYGPATGEKP
jgi:hypothetical protein